MIPETAEANDIAVAFATLGADLKGSPGLPVDEWATPNRVSTMPKDKGPTSSNAMLNWPPNWLRRERRPKRR